MSKPIEYDFDLIHVSCAYHLEFLDKDIKTGITTWICRRCGGIYMFGEIPPEQEQQEQPPEQEQQEQPPEQEQQEQPKRSKRQKTKYKANDNENGLTW